MPIEKMEKQFVVITFDEFISLKIIVGCLKTVSQQKFYHDLVGVLNNCKKQEDSSLAIIFQEKEVNFIVPVLL